MIHRHERTGVKVSMDTPYGIYELPTRILIDEINNVIYAMWYDPSAPNQDAPGRKEWLKIGKVSKGRRGEGSHGWRLFAKIPSGEWVPYGKGTYAEMREHEEYLRSQGLTEFKIE